MASEIMRELVASTRFSYEELISYGDVDKLEDEAFEEVKRHLRTMQDNDTVFFVNTPGTKYVMEETIYSFQNRFPNHNLIVTLDHTLLIEMLDEKSEVQLESDIGKKFIEIRQKINSLNFLVSQLNDKIEDPRRREPGFQFPTKTDFHGSKQVYQAADLVFVIHRPELLNIDVYGREPDAFLSKDMVAVHLLKNREGPANIWERFTQDFKNGSLLPFVQKQSNYNYY
jgi:replicative DNA helicase